MSTKPFQRKSSVLIFFPGQQCDLQYCQGYGEPGNATERKWKWFVVVDIFMGCRTVKVNMFQEMGQHEVPNGNLDTTTALIYDSVTAFAITLNKLDTVQQVNGDDDD